MISDLHKIHADAFRHAAMRMEAARRRIVKWDGAIEAIELPSKSGNPAGHEAARRRRDRIEDGPLARAQLDLSAWWDWTKVQMEGLEIDGIIVGGIAYTSDRGTLGPHIDDDPLLCCRFQVARLLNLDDAV